MRTQLGSLLLSIALSLTACGDDDVTPTPDGGPLDAGSLDASPDGSTTAGDLARDFCGPLADFVCTSAASCGCGAIVPGGALDQVACTAGWTAKCMAAWQPFVTAGAAIDTAAATACVETLRGRTLPCARPDATIMFAVCAPFAIQPVALGEACTSPYCAGGAGGCVSGTCVARGITGAACGDEYGCATGLACNASVCSPLLAADASCAADLDCAPPLHCIAAHCRPLGIAGAACADASDCSLGMTCTASTCTAPSTTACTTSTDCGNRSTCGGASSCQPRGSDGTACTQDGDCVAGSYCDDTSHACIPRPAAGSPCARGVLCGTGLGCDTAGNCATLPTSGQPCAMGEMGPFLCADGLGCIDGNCGALPGVGATCASDNRCAAGLGCDFSPAGSLCIVPRTEGGSCESDRSCAAGFHCGPGTCTADLPTGSPCSVGNECAGVCGIGPGGALECRDAPLAGDPCIFPDECPTALTCAAGTLSCLPEICLEL
jgi:hypothetical protein